jgi:hypothetical protein
MATTELPRTWRPFGARLMAYVLGFLLVALTATVWIAWGPDVRARFTFFQRATLVLLGLMGLSILHALVRSRVTARQDGLVVVNGYRSHRLEWAEVIAVSLRRGAPFATLDLSDGTTLTIWAIQGSDGERANAAVRELRAAMAAQSPAGPDD